MSSEMADWFGAGYFTMTLLVKRGCDEDFMCLGEVIKRWGRVPFIQGPEPPPMGVRMSASIKIIQISKSYIVHVSANKALKGLSIYSYTEREVIESYEF